VFTDGETIQTEVSYQTDRIVLLYTTEETDDASGKFNMQFIHKLDIYVQDIESLRTFLWDPSAAGAAPMRLPGLAEKSNAIAAISGDFFFNRTKGLSVRNGEVIRATVDPEYDICIVYRDGTMRAIGHGEYDEATVEDTNIWQLLSFGPSLLDDDGTPRTAFTIVPPRGNREPTLDSSHYNRRNQRVVFGYVEPGHYIWVLVEAGNKRSRGMRLDELAELMKDYGCVVAYNLDGGQTAQMWFLGELRNMLGYEGKSRFLRDILVVPFPEGSGG